VGLLAGRPDAFEGSFWRRYDPGRYLTD
jgi:hypothetical protein